MRDRPIAPCLTCSASTSQRALPHGASGSLSTASRVSGPRPARADSGSRGATQKARARSTSLPGLDHRTAWAVAGGRREEPARQFVDPRG